MSDGIVLKRSNFCDVTAKLGNMRKEASFTVYPQQRAVGKGAALIQSENRIAIIDLENGKGFVSDGKGGHQGFHKLQPPNKVFPCEVSADVLTTLRVYLKWPLPTTATTETPEPPKAETPKDWGQVHVTETRIC